MAGFCIGTPATARVTRRGPPRPHDQHTCGPNHATSHASHVRKAAHISTVTGTTPSRTVTTDGTVIWALRRAVGPSRGPSRSPVVPVDHQGAGQGAPARRWVPGPSGPTRVGGQRAGGAQPGQRRGPRDGPHDRRVVEQRPPPGRGQRADRRPDPYGSAGSPPAGPAPARPPRADPRDQYPLSTARSARASSSGNQARSFGQNQPRQHQRVAGGQLGQVRTTPSWSGNAKSGSIPPGTRSDRMPVSVAQRRRDHAVNRRATRRTEGCRAGPSVRAAAARNVDLARSVSGSRATRRHAG